jgi:hypothetical protein
VDDRKMLQAILDGQNELRKDLKRVEENLTSEIKENRKRIDKVGN